MTAFSSPLAPLAAAGEVAVIGLGRSGTAAARLLVRAGARVYASDAGAGADVRETAALLAAEGVDAEYGRHDLARIGAAGTVVVSPGVPPSAPALRVAHERGVPVLSEIAAPSIVTMTSRG